MACYPKRAPIKQISLMEVNNLLRSASKSAHNPQDDFLRAKNWRRLLFCLERQHTQHNKAQHAKGAQKCIGMCTALNLCANFGTLFCSNKQRAVPHYGTQRLHEKSVRSHLLAGWLAGWLARNCVERLHCLWRLRAESVRRPPRQTNRHTHTQRERERARFVVPQHGALEPANK